MAPVEEAGIITDCPAHPLVPLYGTFEPLFEFILFAVSLATLTFPIFFVPIKRYARKVVPRAQEQRLSEICAVLSTVCLLIVLLSPFYFCFGMHLVKRRDYLRWYGP